MAKKKSRSTVGDDVRGILKAWKAQGGEWPASAADIADFALKNDLYNVPSRLRQLCADDIARGMREEYLTTEDGAGVRRLHAARLPVKGPDGKVTQKTFWAEIDTADEKFMQVAFQQRRQQIVGDTRQLNTDVTYYNNKWSGRRKPIQMCFDFTDDVAEACMPKEYEGGASE